MTVLWSEGAVANLEAIRMYIAGDNAAAAAKVVMHVLNEVARLRAHPNRGRPGRVAGTRELVIPRTPFIAPYRVRGAAIEVLRVLHSSQRWPDAV